MGNDKINIKVIGLGGIGSHLVNHISQFLDTNIFTKYKTDLTLIDGDTYEEKNVDRQHFSMFGPKSNVKTEELTTIFKNLKYHSIPNFVDEQNVRSLITSGDIVFLCVDNHKTRKIISDYLDTLEDIILISGGNELTDGNVQIYVKKGGKDLTAKITDYHPEIRQASDKLPTEMSCEELQNSQPQILFTNLTVSTLMCQAFFNAVIREDFKKSEIYFDIKTMNSLSKERLPIEKPL